MIKQRVFAAVMACLMWICVEMDIFTTIHSISHDRYGLASVAIGAGIICAVGGVRYTKECIHYTKEFFKEVRK